MPTYPHKPAEIGTYKRFYDSLSEKNSEDESVEIAEVLDWLQEDPTHKKAKSKKKGYAKKLLEAGVEFSAKKSAKSAAKGVAKGAAKGASAAASAVGSLTPSLIDNIVEIFTDLYYAARDVYSGRRKKTSATITAGIIVGAVAGFVIGTFVLPGVGSAIGGAAGAAIVSTLASVGGIIGLTILGAVGGSWLGTKISKFAFKHESKFELSNRKTKRIKKYLGLRSKEAEMINGYLVNRIKAVESPTCKRYYSYLRKLLIEKPEDLGLKKAADFFENELKLLERQRKIDGSTPELGKEIQAVVHILRVIAGDNTRGLLLKTRHKLKDLCATYDATTSPNTAPSPTKSNSVPREPAAAPSLSRGQKRKREYVAQFMMDKSSFSQGNPEKCSKELVAKAKEHYEKTGDATPTILADGVDSIAVRLFAAALEVGLRPELDEAEYPEDTLENRKRKLKVIEDSYALAGRTPPGSRPAKRPRLTHEGH